MVERAGVVHGLSTPNGSPRTTCRLLLGETDPPLGRKIRRDRDAGRRQLARRPPSAGARLRQVLKAEHLVLFVARSAKSTSARVALAGQRALQAHEEQDGVSELGARSSRR